jgi:hypothetical protein
LAVSFGALLGCRSKGGADAAPSASAAVAEVPAPQGLLAELTLGNPKDTWQRLRLLLGEAAQALPSSLPVLLTTSLSLPPAAAGNLDEGLPMVGVLLSRSDSSEPDAVLGMHVVSGAELVASLTLGDAAKFRRVEVAPHLVRLLPAPGLPELNGVLGVSGNYLLVATRVEALAAAGRFVAEALPRRASNDVGLRVQASQQVLSGSISRVLRQAWQAQRAALEARDRAEREAKGRAPDFADPAVLLGGMDSTVESWLGVLEGSRELLFEVVPEGDRLRVELSLTPAATGPAAQLAGELLTGSIAPLLALPASTRAALLFRGSDAGAEAEPGQGAAQLFGERLDPKQAARLSEALGALWRARRGAIVIGLVAAPSPALSFDCEVNDPVAFTSAIGETVGLVQLPVVSKWLTGTLGQPTLTLGKPNAGVSTARLQLHSSKRPPGLPLPTDLRLAWAASDGVGRLVASSDAKLVPASLAEGPRLGATSWLARSEATLAASVATALYVDVGQLVGGPGGASSGVDAHLLLSFGKRGERVAVRLEAAPGALGSLRALAAVFGQ